MGNALIHQKTKMGNALQPNLGFRTLGSTVGPVVPGLFIARLPFSHEASSMDLPFSVVVSFNFSGVASSLRRRFGALSSRLHSSPGSKKVSPVPSSWKALPTENDEHPKIYRMKLWATNEVCAKSKFWHFLRKLKKVKKSNGQVLAINEVVVIAIVGGSNFSKISEQLAKSEQPVKRVGWNFR